MLIQWISILSEMHLPAALDALSKPIGLPSSILAKADEVRQANGPVRIEKMMQDVKTLHKQCYDTIDLVRPSGTKQESRMLKMFEQCFSLLDDEHDEDNQLRAAIASHDVWTRPESSVANKALTDELTKHHRMLNEARKTDKTAEKKWAKWSEVIELLCKEHVRPFFAVMIYNKETD